MRRNLLLLVFVALAVVVAYDYYSRSREERRIRNIERLGGFIDHGGRFIVLGGEEITDAVIEPLSHFPELEYLALPQTAIGPQGISELRQFKFLVGLEVLRSRVTPRFCAQVGTLPKLRVLKMIQTGTTDECLAELSQISDLEVLDLSNCPVSTAGLRHLVVLHKLRTLSLSSTKVDDDSIEYLRKLPRLERVDVDDTRMTANGITQLHEASPACQVNYSVELAPDVEGFKAVPKAHGRAEPSTSPPPFSDRL